MAGPALDPVKVQQFEKGFSGQNGNPQDLMGQITKGYQQALPQGSPGSLPSPAEPQAAPVNEHMMNMEQKAVEAKEKYKLEHGVDDNGDPVSP